MTWTLLKFELKKILHRTVTRVSLVAAALFILLVSSGLPISYVSTNSRNQSGMLDSELLAHNKEISSEFTGALTDDKIQSIIYKYNLMPFIDEIQSQSDEKEKQYTKDFERNVLSNFVMRSFVDNSGNILSVKEVAGENEIYYGFSPGFDEFIWDYKLVASIAVIVSIIGISPLYSSDYSEKTDSLVLTAKYGKSKLISAKTAAAVLFASVSFIFFTGICIISNGLIFGWEGFDKSLLLSQTAASGYQGSLSVGMFSLIYILLVYTAVLICSFFTMLLSSRFQPFVSVIVSAGFFIATGLVDIGKGFSRGITQMLPAQFIKPEIYLSANEFSPADINLMIGILAFVSAAICVFFSCRNFKNHQVI